MSYRIHPLLWPVMALIDFLGYVLCFPLRFREMPTPRRILVMRLDHLGDMLLTTPLLTACKERYPDAEVHVLTRDAAASLLEDNEHVDHIITVNTPWFARGDAGSWREVWSLAWRLRNRYDLVLECHGDPRSILLASVIGGYRIGFGIRGFGFLLHERVHFGRDHQVRKLLRLIDGKNHPLLLPIADPARERIRALDLPEHFIVLHPGAGDPAKELAPDQWRELMALLPEADYVVVDAKPTKTTQVLSEFATDFSGKLSLRELAALIDEADALIGMDSLSVHMAAARKTPAVDIHDGISYAEEWGPWSADALAIQERPPHIFAGQTGGIEYMRSLDMRRLAELITAFLEKNAKACVRHRRNRRKMQR